MFLQQSERCFEDILIKNMIYRIILSYLSHVFYVAFRKIFKNAWTSIEYKFKRINKNNLKVNNE